MKQYVLLEDSEFTTVYSRRKSKHLYWFMTSDTMLLLQHFTSRSCRLTLLPWHVWASFCNLTTTFSCMRMLLFLLSSHSKHPHTNLSPALFAHTMHRACATFFFFFTAPAEVILTRKDALSVCCATFKSLIFPDSTGGNQADSRGFSGGFAPGWSVLEQDTDWISASSTARSCSWPCTV